jgi:hypothetical protein
MVQVVDRAYQEAVHQVLRERGWIMLGTSWAHRLYPGEMLSDLEALKRRV